MSESPRSGRTVKWLIRAVVCALGFPVFVILHNLFDGIAAAAGGGFISGLLGVLSGASFVVAVFLAPAGAVICLVLAGVDPLTARWKQAPRLGALLLVPALAAGVAVSLFVDYLSISLIERDGAVGFNGSFESVKSGLPINWYVYRSPVDSGVAELSYDSEDPIDGDQSLKLLVHPTEAEGGRLPGVFQVADAVEGQTYRVSFWLKNRGSSVRLLINSENPESSEPRNPIEEIIDAAATGDDTWREFVYTYRVPEHYDNIRFELDVVAPGTLWVDHVRIEPLSGE